MSKAENIAALRGAGFTLIPLNGKIPAVTEWQKAGPNDYPMAGAGDKNYGVALKAGDLVIDVDPRHFSPSTDKPLARLVAAIGAPLSSFTVRTGGGGLHIYLAKPADITIAHTLEDYPGLEFKSSGRQVVGPGSIHPDSHKEYKVIAGAPDNISPAPEKLLALLKVTAIPFAEIGDGLKDYKNDTDTQGRMVEYLTSGSAPLSIEGKEGDATAFKVACYGRDLGLPPATTLSLLCEYWNPRCLPPWEDAEIEAKVINVYKYAKRAAGNKHPAADFDPVAPVCGPVAAEDKTVPSPIAWDTDANGKVKKTFFNLLNYLRLPNAGLDGIFARNEFTGQVEFTAPAPWHKGVMPRGGGGSAMVGDLDLKLLKGHLAVRHGFEMTTNNLEEAVAVTAHSHRFHPVRDYLRGLKWDGRRRLDTWLIDYAGTEDSPYTRAVGRKTLCAAVARIMKPGCKFDQVLVLEGEQNAGKSMLCEALGGDWAADFPIDPHRADTIAAMQGKWIIELAEMAVLRRTERSALKAFISRRTDKVRVAYGRLHMEYLRQSIFIATINPEADMTYLEDPTGNRRWWPVTCGRRVDFKGIKVVRDQLYAEAVDAVKKGESIFMDTEKLEVEAGEVVKLRHAGHPWTERILLWLVEADARTGKPREFVTARDIYIEALGGLDKQLKRMEVVAIATVMRSLEWEGCVKWINDHPMRGYRRAGTGRQKKEEVVGADLAGLEGLI